MKQRIASLDEWRSTIAREMSPLDIYADKPDKFGVELHTRRTAQTRLINILSTPQHFVRTPQQVHPTDAPVFSLAVQLEGEGHAAQNGNEGFLLPGDLCLFDWTIPHMRAFESEFSMFTIMFPQRLLPLPPRVLSRVCGTTIDGSTGLGHVASALVKSLAREDIDFRVAAGGSVVHSAIQVVRGALAEVFDQMSGDGASGQDAAVFGIQQYVLENLSSPDLTPEAVARAHYMSLRKLHQLFRNEGQTVAAWIREQRLERVCRDLEDPFKQDLPLHRIAAVHGLGEATQFARAFRSAYGCTPSAYRHRALSMTGSPGIFAAA